jgi:hypothetical protein
VQGVLAGAVAVVLAVLWRSKASFNLKAAALAAATVLVVRYIFLYDLVILAVAMAFLLRACGEAGPTPGEMRVLAIAGLLIIIFPLVKVPTGLAAALVVAFLIIRRAGLVPERLGSWPARAYASRSLRSHASAATHLAMLLIHPAVGKRRQER